MLNILKNNRLRYFSAHFTTLILGVLSRKISEIPLFIGDVLYAVLIYFGLRFLFIHLKTHKTFLLSLLFCFSIEILQLVQIDWLIGLRKTTLGHYILGHYHEDAGQVYVPKSWGITYLAQAIPEGKLSAKEYVLHGHAKYIRYWHAYEEA